MQGIYGYRVDSKKQNTPLNTVTPTQIQTATAVPTNQANYLAVNKYSLAGLAFLAGILLK